MDTGSPNTRTSPISRYPGVSSVSAQPGGVVLCGSPPMLRTGHAAAAVYFRAVVAGDAVPLGLRLEPPGLLTSRSTPPPPAADGDMGEPGAEMCLLALPSSTVRTCSVRMHGGWTPGRILLISQLDTHFTPKKLTLEAKLSEQKVSSALKSTGLTHTNMSVLLSPPSESCEPHTTRRASVGCQGDKALLEGSGGATGSR